MSLEKHLTINYKLGMDQETVLNIKVKYGFEYNCYENWGFAYEAEDFLGNRFTSKSLEGLLQNVYAKNCWPKFKERSS